MTRPTKLSGILSGTFGIITLIFALTTADWSNRDDVILSVLFSLVLMGLVFGITFGLAYTSEKHRQSPKMAKQNDSAGGLAVLFVIGLGAYGMYATDWGFSKGQITDYALKCTSDDYVNNRCNGSYAQGPVTVYTVNADQQFVISQTDREPPARLSKCAIVDRKNWKCNAPDGNDFISIAYTDGEYQGILVQPFYRHVSRYEWLWADKASGQSRPK